MTIWFASGNAHKKKELKDILGEILSDPIHIDILNRKRPFKWELKIPSEAGIDFGPEETGNTFLDNALIKAGELRCVLDGKGLLRPGDAVIADDSGLCVDALGGRPGLHSAYYGSPNADTKIDAGEQNALLLAELGDNPQRSGRFVCCMVLYFSADRFFVAQETFEGELVKEMRGKGGFGYDPILYIPSLRRTVAELTVEEKNCFSHRGKAARTLADIIVGEILANECR